MSWQTDGSGNILCDSSGNIFDDDDCCCGCWKQASSCDDGSPADVWMTCDDADSVSGPFYLTGTIGACYQFTDSTRHTSHGSLYTPADVTSVDSCDNAACQPVECGSCGSYCFSSNAILRAVFTITALHPGAETPEEAEAMDMLAALSGTAIEWTSPGNWRPTIITSSGCPHNEFSYCAGVTSAGGNVEASVFDCNVGDGAAAGSANEGMYWMFTLNGGGATNTLVCPYEGGAMRDVNHFNNPTGSPLYLSASVTITIVDNYCQTDPDDPSSCIPVVDDGGI